MQSVGTFFSTVSKIYNEINPATLSGAIDVVVVEQPDGELAGSPFHVRFGKLNLLRPQDKIVEMTVNGRVVDLPMKVGKAGEAFFVFQTELDVPEEFATSPLVGPASDKSEDEIDFLDLSRAAKKDKDQQQQPQPQKKKKMLKDEERRHRRNKSQQQKHLQQYQQQQQQQQLPTEKDRGSQDLHDQDLEAGYVSAHSGHGTDFGEDKDDNLQGSRHGSNSIEPPSPSPSPLQSILSTDHLQVIPRSGPTPHRGAREGAGAGAGASISPSSPSPSAPVRHRSSFSVPSSPRMGPARNSVGQVGRLDHPLEGNAGASHRRRQSRRQSRRDQHTPGAKQAVTKESDGGYHPLTPSSPEDSSVFDNGAVQGGSGEGGGLIQLRPSATTKATAGANADNVILDMTGYKTDDSDDLSDGETIVFREHHHLHRRRQRSPFMAMATDNTSSGSTGESRVQKSAYRKTRGMRGIGEVATALLATSSASPSSASSSFEDDNDDDEDEEEDEEEDEDDEDENEVALKEQQSRRIASRLPCPAARNNAGSGSTNSPRLGWPGRERSNSLPNLHQLAVSDRMDMTSMMTTALRELHGQADAVNDKERKATMMMMMAMKEKKEIDDDEDKDDERQRDFKAVDSAIASSVSVTPSSAKGSATELPSPHVPPLPPSMPAVAPPGTTTSHRAALGMHHHRKPSSVRVNQAMNALSDTELEYQTPRVTSATGSAEWTWGWGGLPVKHNEGMDDDDEEHHGQDASAANRERAGEVSPKPVLREMEIGGQVYRLAISMCPGDDFGKDLKASEVLFTKNQVSFEEFSQDPLKFLNDPCLVCLVNDKYFTWSAAGPQLASLLLFHQPLPDSTLHQLSAKDARSFHLTDETEPPTSTSSSRAGGAPPTRFSALSRWFRGSPSTSSTTTTTTMTTTNSSTTMVSSMSVSTTGDSDSQAKQQKLGSSSSPSLDAVSSNPPQASENEKLLSLEEGQDLIEDEESNETITVVVEKRSGPHAHSRHDRRYAKTLRLTSDQLKSLNLKRGANTLTFSVASSYQGKATCVAKLFLWQYDYQVVISDIDGTITKSDALGHLFTMAGKDWTHLGVAKLYTDIVNNGYHVLYLTSRAIGQADYTRKYLKGVEQDNYQLPDGPVIMSPDRLFTAFHREVIMRKPEEFKMACLRDIKRLFGERNPFYAGFGNRYTDMLSYRSVSVPVSRIFTIDPGGEVKLELLSTYKSTYIALNDLVHQMFPCQKVVSEYNDWNYWKQPLPTIELPLAPTSTPQPLQTKIPIDSGHNSGGHSQHHQMGTIPVSPSSSGGRLGVIRTLTNSLTSAGSLKKRPSIPAFASSPAALGHGANAFLATSSMTTMTTMTTTTMSTTTMSAAAATSTTIQMGSSGDRASGGDSVQSSNGGASGGFVPASPPPSSAPSRLDIATKGRRLSLSLMRYGSSNSQNSASSTATMATTSSSSSSQATLVESGTSIAATYSSSSVTSSTSLLAGSTTMSATTSSSSSSSSSAAVTSGIIGQGVIGGSSLPLSSSSSSPGDSTIDVSTSDNDHRGDGSRIVVERRAASASPPPPAAPPVTRSRGFSVSPPPLASRLSETLLPYLRGSSSLSSSLNHSASVAAENSTPPPTATATTITTTSATTMVAGRGRSHSSAGSGGGNNNNNNSNNNSSSNGGSAGDGTVFLLDEQDQLALDNMEPIVGSWPTSDRLANLHRHGGGSSGGGGSGGGGGGGGGFSWTGRGMEEQSVLLSPFTELGSERRYGGVEEDEDEDVDEDLDLEDEDDEIDYEDDDELELEEEEELFPDEEPHLEAPFL